MNISLLLEVLAYLRANDFKTFIVSGGGVEFMHASHISFGLEYLRYDFESERYNPVDLFGNTAPAEIDMDTSIVRARASLHFN